MWVPSDVQRLKKVVSIKKEFPVKTPVRVVRLGQDLKASKLLRVSMPPPAQASTQKYTYSLSRGVSYSRLSSFLACRQRCAYECQGWRRIESKESLTFGGMFHELLEHYYNMIRGKGVTYKHFKAELPDWINAWVEPVCQNALKKGADAELVERCAALAAGLFPGYVERWKDDWTRRTWLALEKEFKEPWHGHTLYGFRDGVFRESKKLWILETKTKAQIELDLGDAVTFDAQNLYYALATELEMKEHVTGVLYNVIRKPAWKLEGVPNDVVQKRAQMESTKDPKHFYVRYPVRISRQHLKRYGEELDAKLNDFKAWLEGKLPTYRNEGSCIQKWNCPFIPVCATGSYLGFQREEGKHDESGKA